MAYTITPQRIEELKQYLKDHPIDHAYDDPPGKLARDGDMPDGQAAATHSF